MINILKMNNINILHKSVCFALAGTLISCAELPAEGIISPAPVSIELSCGGAFDTTIPMALSTDGPKVDCTTIIGTLPQFDFSVDMGTGKSNEVSLRIVESSIDLPDEESYRLSIKRRKVEIEAISEAGLFYGAQSLRQLAEYYGSKIPAMTVLDTPRFAYRGMMLDASRHFLSVEFILRQLDAMARYKLNRFHWHLTDGAGWRIEIEKYPELTAKAAWRPQAGWKEWQANGRPYCLQDDPGAYGGYYTAEQIKQVVEYAGKLHIEVIPEIEMPGHSEEVLAVYPELSCTGQPYTASEFCIGNEKTFTFIEDVLTEVIRLFPSQYIHIGGDEASRAHWEKCPRCQARIKQEGLSGTAQLQGYMIERIAMFLDSHGRRMVGWDEILEGGVPEGATVMAWRGADSGIKAAYAGHDVVMVPVNYCYFDYYQDAPPSQPEAMAPYLPLSKAYSFDPAPDSLDTDIKRHILGTQCNLWAEYMTTQQQVEYMIYPRMLALAEVAWSMPDKKDYEKFRKRTLKEVAYLQAKGYNTFDLANEIGPRPESKIACDHLATGKKVEYQTGYAQKYRAAGDATLTDGLRGDWAYTDGRWQGFIDTDMRVVIDLDSVKTVRSVKANFMQCSGAWVWMPAEVAVEASADGNNFIELGSQQTRIPVGYDLTEFETLGWEGEATARYIRFTARSNGNAGGWMFTDEIMVE